MALRLVSPGRGPVRDVVLLYNLPGATDAAVVDAAQGACILNDTRTPTTRYARSGPAGILPLRATLAVAQDKAGRFEQNRILVGGLGPGGHAPRTLLLDSARGEAVPDAVVVADGTHASRPPQPWEIDVWRAYLGEARAGRKVAVFSHTCIESASQLSTRETLRQLTGWPLEAAGDVGSPVRMQQGKLVVESYAGSEAADHEKQARIVFPELLRCAMALLWDLPADDPDPDETLPIATPLGARALAKSLAELKSGAGEDPPRSGDGPRIREYLAGCSRAADATDASSPGDWGTAACCWAAFSVLQDGERPPHEWRADAREVWEDAQAAGVAILPERVRSRTFRVRSGDLAVFRQRAAWSMGRVELPPDPHGRYTTVEGARDGRWASVQRDLADADLVGFVEYPR